MNPPRRLCGTIGMCNLREGFVNLREGFVVAPWRLREAFSKTRSAKASRSPLEGFAKASRRRHGRLHLETIRQIMTSPRNPLVSLTLNRSSFLKETNVLIAFGVQGLHCLTQMSDESLVFNTFTKGLREEKEREREREGLHLLLKVWRYHAHT